MNRRLLEILACPACGARVEPLSVDEHGDDIASGLLACPSCNRRYAIDKGIPRLVPDDLGELQQRTAEAFGWEWQHFNEMHDEFEAQFLDWIQPLEPSSFKGKDVLDAGCGKGRHAYFAASYGARRVVGLDLSNAVDAAAEIVGSLDAVDLVQGDLVRPPLAAANGEGLFDLVYSIGVLHHLPVPQDGFRALARLVRSGGRILVWVYAREGNEFVRRFVEPIRRVTTRMPPSLMRAIAWPLAVAFHGAAKAVYAPGSLKPVAERLPLYAYMESVSRFTFSHNYAIVFDQLVAPTTHYISRDELEQWFAEAGLEDVTITRRNENSWRAVGRRPPAPA